MNTNVKIEVKNIYKIFGNHPESAIKRIHAGESKAQILRETAHVVGLTDVSLTIREGEIFVIMGLSGSGKSTLIRHFNRLIEPTSGEVLIDGRDILKFGKNELETFRRKKISMVFQRFGLLPHETVLSNAAFGLRIQGVSKKEREEIARHWLEQVGLSGVEAHYPAQLSGGMQQRVGLARALVNDPDILLMDEAFSALDPLIKAEMQEQLLQLQKKLNKTIVFITHDLDEALKIGDKIAILKDGELIQTGTASDILMSPSCSYVEDFIGGVNRSKAIKVEHLMHSVSAVAIGDKAAAERVTPHSTVRRNQSLEEVIPILMGVEKNIAVVDEDNSIVGYLDKAKVISALRVNHP
ncbi:glycine betaine/L-proline ABC transporter ATP-binding protein [Pseudomonas sp. CDFA 553]|uniref:quaternary amine ABC transporter ATP-binding protein n=1 Tax=Pseudomonas quasicaspiana TaxID=2829821 RepID=UPI001E505225|nr:glycine betaine/L-proline ABC transporter ATP-binding protein [Pseudomonas quasicaspiana]MCD5987208.1 glycine betaine/L-proline ABC transporter ATP-binding protein [Pseudomonas quasicaspiana]